MQSSTHTLVGLSWRLNDEVDAVAVPVARVGVGHAAELEHRGVEQADAVLLGQRFAREQLVLGGLDQWIAESEIGDEAHCAFLSAPRRVAPGGTQYSGRLRTAGKRLAYDAGAPRSNGAPRTSNTQEVRMSIFKRSRLLLGALLALFVFTSNGCGSGGGESTATHSETSADSAASSAGGETAQPAPSGHGETATSSSATDPAAPAAEPGVVHLIDKGCIQFEPHWVTIAPGQTVTWVSDLKAPVTVHVDAGAFNKTQFVIAPRRGA